MSRRKTDGERIADRLFGLALDNQEPKWLAAKIDRVVRRRMAEAWEDGWFDRDCQELDWYENPYRRKRKVRPTKPPRWRPSHYYDKGKP